MTSECTELVLMSEKHDAINAPVKEHGDQTVDAARRREGLGHHLLLHLVGKGVTRSPSWGLAYTNLAGDIVLTGLAPVNASRVELGSASWMTLSLANTSWFLAYFGETKGG